jgi:hypothetical protein
VKKIRWVILFSFALLCLAAAYLRLQSRPIETGETASGPLHTLPDPSLLKEGDVVLRAGKGVISALLQKMSLHDRSFSHAGILLDSCGKWFVIHMYGGQGSSRSDLRLDPLEDYCSSRNSDSSAVFRLTEADSIRTRIAAECRRLLSQPPRFDSRFDLSTDDQLYCTEMVYKVFRKAYGDGISLPLTEFAGERYAACDDLYLNPYAHLVKTDNDHVH